MSTENAMTVAPVQCVVPQPRIKLHFDPHYMTFGYWWVEVPHLPAIGSHLIPFENDQEGLDWEWGHDCVKVESHLWFVERGLVCVGLKVDGNWGFEPPEGFDEAMIRAGWTKGDAEAWV